LNRSSRSGSKRISSKRVYGGVGNDLKHVELATRCCTDLAVLAVALRRAKEQLGHKRDVI
jgi:hypothetical protein